MTTDALAMVACGKLENASSIKGHWDVHFSRFFTDRATLQSTCPDLIPITRGRRNRISSGMWLASDSTASLHLHNLGSRTETILIVCLNELILEEHFISKLHFTWPQVLCMSGFPARGSRAVLVSYRDSEEQVQKFALQFVTSCETEEFMNFLKENLDDSGSKLPTDVELPNSDAASAVCSHSLFMSSSPSSYICPNEPDTTSKLTPESQTTSKVAPMMDPECHQYSHPTQTPIFELENALAAFPPSFTSLLSCLPLVEQPIATDITQPTASQEAELRRQILMYMEDSRFQEMLFKVEQVMAEATAP